MFDQLILQSTNGNTSWLTVIMTVLIAFILSSLIVITYDFTTKGVKKSVNFLQSLALISIVASTVMQAIGDSVGLGLGMIGVFSIIRFRTALDNPRNMVFMFASLAVGISCGVYGYAIAVAGTLGFCLVALLISYTPLGQTNELVGTLKLQIPKDVEARNRLTKVLNKYCNGFDLDQYRFLSPKKIVTIDEAGIRHVSYINRDHIQEKTYLIKLRTKYQAYELSEVLESDKDFNEVRVKFSKESNKM